LNDTNEKEPEELSEEEKKHRMHMWIGSITTLVVLIVFSLLLFRHLMEEEKIVAQKKAAQQAAIEDAQREAFWKKNALKEFKEEREQLLKRIESESRMIQWGYDRQASPTVIEQAKARREAHQKRLDEVNKQIIKLRDL